MTEEHQNAHSSLAGRACQEQQSIVHRSETENRPLFFEERTSEEARSSYLQLVSIARAVWDADKVFNAYYLYRSFIRNVRRLQILSPSAPLQL